MHEGKIDGCKILIDCFRVGGEKTAMEESFVVLNVAINHQQIAAQELVFISAVRGITGLYRGWLGLKLPARG